MRPTYPTLANVSNGQVLSAEQLKSYNAALEYLFAESHAPMALGGAMLGWTTDDSPSETPHTAWTGYTRHAGTSLQYAMECNENSDDEGQEYHVIIQYCGDDGAYHTVATITGDGEEQFESGAVDISGATMTVGNIYEWRLQVYGNTVGEHGADDYNVTIRHWWLAEYGQVDAESWQAPNHFTCSQGSDADHLNDWHTDLDLIEAVIPDMNWLYGGNVEQEHSDSDWHEVFRGAYPYRPNELYLGVRAQVTSSRVWQWRAAITDTAGSSVIMYTSPEITGTGASQTDTTTLNISPDTILGALIEAGGVHLALGSYYRVRLDTKKVTEDAEVLYSQAGWLARLSTGAAFDGTQLLANGDFETKGTGTPDVFGSWAESAGGGSIGFDAANYYAGTLSAVLTQGTSSTYISQGELLTARQPYTLEFYTHGDGTHAGSYGVYNASVGWLTGDDTSSPTSTGVAGTAWTAVTTTFMGPAVNLTCQVLLIAPAALGAKAWFDDVVLKDASWQALPAWEHGDRDVGPIKLNKVSSNIGVFTTGGAEQLFGSNLITPAYTDDTTTDRYHTGVHRKRYLHYLPLNGTTDPTVHYGDRSEVETLTAGTTWSSIDLETVDNLAYGMYYDVKNAMCAFEADD